MAGTLLIASAAYVEPELEVEFGRIPPAFLPLGNRRLYQHQHEFVCGWADRIVLSLPESFTPDDHDLHLLESLGIEPVFVPDGLPLGQSLIYVINVTAASLAPVSVLHGDTVLIGIAQGDEDAVSIDAAPPPGYHWGYASVRDGRVEIEASEDPDQRVALTGFFRFASPTLFLQTVTRNGGSFLRGLADYARRRPMRPVVAEEWLDFGHAGTFYRSRRRFTTERAFNRLAATPRTVVKSGRNAGKLEAEATWFEGLPPRLRIFAPAYLGRGAEGAAFSYELEYLYLPTLAELFVFGRLGAEAWRGIFEACDEFLGACRRQAAPAATPTGGLYLDKTLERLETFARTRGIDPTAPCRLNGTVLPSLTAMAEQAAAVVEATAAGPATLVHGDFCFSNILFDTRAGRVRVIDPRGLDRAGRPSPWGDARYDIGKLHHSAIGLYDFIVADRHRVVQNGATDFDFELPATTEIRRIGEVFMQSRFAGQTAAEAAAPAISVLLFLSMLPLHADDERRQNALLANGMRLFLELDRATAG